jgi:hypothetical protein
MKQRPLIATLASMMLASSVVLASGMTAAVAADAPTKQKDKVPQSHPEKSCTSLAAEAKAECERVAAKMRESAKDAKGPNDASTEGVGMHSSPVMTDQKEMAVEEAHRKGKDPRKAVEKIEAKDNPPAT